MNNSQLDLGFRRKKIPDFCRSVDGIVKSTDCVVK